MTACNSWSDSCCNSATRQQRKQTAQQSRLKQAADCRQAHFSAVSCGLKTGSVCCQKLQPLAPMVLPHSILSESGCAPSTSTTAAPHGPTTWLLVRIRRRLLSVTKADPVDALWMHICQG